MPCTMIHVREVTRYFLAASLEVPAVTEAVLISLLAGIYYIGFPNNFFFQRNYCFLCFVDIFHAFMTPGKIPILQAHSVCYCIFLLCVLFPKHKH